MLDRVEYLHKARVVHVAVFTQTRRLRGAGVASVQMKHSGVSSEADRWGIQIAVLAKVLFEAKVPQVG